MRCDIVMFFVCFVFVNNYEFIRLYNYEEILINLPLQSVCCDTVQALVFLLESVCSDTAQALVFLLVSMCCDTAQALMLLLV